jgi:hypothetical protein
MQCAAVVHDTALSALPVVRNELPNLHPSMEWNSHTPHCNLGAEI